MRTVMAASVLDPAADNRNHRSRSHRQSAHNLMAGALHAKAQMSASSANRDAALQRHADEIAALLEAVLQSRGRTSPAMRMAAFRGEPGPLPLADYLANIQTASYRITDGDVARLLDAGYSEDALFELTIASALGAAYRRLEAGLRALGEQ